MTAFGRTFWLTPAVLAASALLSACPDPHAPKVKVGPSGIAERVPTWDLTPIAPVPAFSLLDQSGAPVSEQDLLGTPWLGSFMFTSCPDICPTLSARMSEVQENWGEQLHIVSFSVDPATDTPEKLAEYAARFDAHLPHWRFLTGDATAMKTVVVGGFKQVMERAPAANPEPGEPPETVLHGSRFVLVDKTGQIRAYPDPDVPGEIEGYVGELLKQQP